MRKLNAGILDVLRGLRDFTLRAVGVTAEQRLLALQADVERLQAQLGRIEQVLEANQAAADHRLAVLAAVINNQHNASAEISEIKHWVGAAAMQGALSPKAEAQPPAG